MKFLLSTILLTIILISCSTRSKQDDWDKENLRALEIDDERVARAMKAAQDSLQYYIEYFNKYYGKENYSFYLKKSYTDNDVTEHMWAIPFRLSEDGFACVLDNVPNDMTNYELGDTVKVRFDEVEDFFIVTEDSVVIGNYLQKEIENAPLQNP
ncbi:MAG TPA: DUF2314 domain-containing protein [Cyclobacteriaceae bacterium]|nr:DUF2314 domain-containing protein [Cyclobacteriaceae bacterium]HMV09529.1 DUF2314 domain-containing protein [Cyclobacteriaceae bacterium]HMX02008.1 DUF2314 domain-containing protein [Cyclobacteriaceae bacterium]HMX51877.1 DUF2314 domain-containing protein [Cyclobacteriaceae bacterium]HMY94831.1 DUF2314 domain-containing protein [Cyclobacteriaceae bacterium]